MLAISKGFDISLSMVDQTTAVNSQWRRSFLNNQEQREQNMYLWRLPITQAKYNVQNKDTFDWYPNSHIIFKIGCPFTGTRIYLGKLCAITRNNWLLLLHYTFLLEFVVGLITKEFKTQLYCNHNDFEVPVVCLSEPYAILKSVLPIHLCEL